MTRPSKQAWVIGYDNMPHCATSDECIYADEAAARKAARAKLQAMREGIDRQLASLEGGTA